MSVERERLIPVTSEAELRVGMLVVFRACMMCQRDHVCLLTRAAPAAPGWHTGGTCWASRDWETQPVTCAPSRPACCCEAIRDGRMFIVDPFSESDTPTEAKRPAPRRLERAR